jgi:hypothetical protein
MIAYVLAALAGSGFVLAVIHWYTVTLVKIGVSDIAWSVVFILLGLFVGKTIVKIIRYRKTMTQVVTGFGLATFGYIAANLHLLIFDKLYLHKGKRPTKKLVINLNEPATGEPVEAAH